MNFAQKLRNLQRLEPCVLYKWTTGHKRLAGQFLPVNNLRLVSVICDGGKVTLSEAAPVVVMNRGRSSVHFSDRNVMTVLNGERVGVNVFASWLDLE